MFEVTADQIALLNDEDLRSLVGLLCESEVRQRGISRSCVKWGGNQRAADGGLDVRVVLPPGVEIEGFVPRPNTGFQAKAEEMSPSKITAEMRPGGVLRPAIRALAEQAGAYIIVSSKSFLSDIALQKRIKAMSEAAGEAPNAGALRLDFYDRRRLETWLRDHAGTSLWVRERIGKPIQGWSGYGAWSNDPEGPDAEFLLDNGLRVKDYRVKMGPSLSAVDGIISIRHVLWNPRGVVRLAGLSGVGKTRLVQALFDYRVGEHSLDPGLAVYTNLNDSPNPQPAALASELISTQKRACLVVDNCPPDVHHRLLELCRSGESSISLITIEYDIREDQPEGTDVFVLEAASTGLVEILIKRRFPGLSPVDAQRIANFSGGNARIAIALAERIERGESITHLSDEDLFGRLFHQRHQADEIFFSAAQALSLVYSFQGEDVSGDAEAELSPLGTLVGKNAQEMFRHSAELERRGLLQRRGRWRAILPPAIANCLAATALQNVPPDAIEGCFLRSGRERLLKSFSRRLGYLDSSREAKAIASKWLSSEGLLGCLPDFNDLGDALFQNIAPVAPEETLRALERVLLWSEKPETAAKCRRFLRLLASLAYEAPLLERCTALIVKIAEAGDVLDHRDEALRVFASLFTLYLSGTHATPEQRLAVIKALLLSEDEKKEALGLAALKAALEAIHFSAGWGFEFGAHSRDYGYSPRTLEDVKRWFASALDLVEQLVLSDRPIGRRVRDVLAEQFQGLWSASGVYGKLDRICRRISEKEFWAEGWIAVRQTIHYDSSGFGPDVAAQLASLEACLRPKDLPEKVRSIVLSEALLGVGIDSAEDGSADIQRAMDQVEAAARDLGKASAADQGALAVLLPELLAGNSVQLWSFGRGLAEGAGEPRAIWGQLVAQLGAIPREMQSVHVIRGFLNALNQKEPGLVGSLLDDSIDDADLGPWFPVLQTAVGIDKKGVTRLIRSLEVGKAGIRIYRNLVVGGVTHPMSGRDFNDLLMRIAGSSEGLDIAIEILSMRISYAAGRSSPSELVDIGCELMRRVSFRQRNAVGDHYLGIVAQKCLVGEKGGAAVREMCRNIKQEVARSETYAFHHTGLLKILFSAQPLPSLACFIREWATRFDFEGLVAAS
jgi:hypothetical protein